MANNSAVILNDTPKIITIDNLLTPEEDTTGKKVIHEKYGKGVVVETSGNEITIDFGEEWGIKHLDVEWAPIKFE